MVITVNDYEQIRKRFLAGESQRSIAKSLGISRNTVKKYCEGASVPWERKSPERIPSVITYEVLEFIRSCLEEDRTEGIRKQQHTAKRIYDRLVAEMGFTGGESTVRRAVHELKGSLPDVYVPLQFDPGEAMQTDWGEAYVYMDGARAKVYLFCARLCFSCKPVVLAYRRQDQESFLDAYVRTFNLIGGVPRKVIFDNGSVAVKSGHGTKAVMQDGYAALRAHYGFDAEFCNPAEGHEKGLVEGLVGWARRNICVPVPRVSGISELNELLAARCLDYEKHCIAGRGGSVGGLFAEERPALMPLPRYVFETARCADARVSALSTVRYRSNSYSVPVRYAGRRVGVKGYPETVEIYFGGELISRHDRLFGRNQTSYHLDDYMPLLERRPRAVLDAAPVRQNVPGSVLERLKSSGASHEETMRVIRLYAVKGAAKSAPDPVTVPPVDLGEYDGLCIGREAAAND